MADPVWPFGCPVSWSQKPRTSLIRSEVESGLPKQRARFTKSYIEITVSWTLKDYALVEQFENFFKVDLDDGALPFRLENPLTGKTVRVRFKESPTAASDVSRKPTWSLEGSLEEVLT